MSRSVTIRTNQGVEAAKIRAKTILKSKNIRIATVFNVKGSDKKDYTFTNKEMG